MRSNVLFGFTALCGLAASARAQTPVPPAPGDVAISEIMFTPACAGNQNSAEWFEVTNISTKVIDLMGVYITDGSTPLVADPSKYFQVLPSVTTLPPLYPGQRFVFARSANSLLNGGLPVVDYEYAQDVNSPDAPADKSKVGFTKQNFSSQDLDGCHISVQAPLGAPGSVLIATASYNPVVAPFQLPYTGGGSAEMVNLYGSFVVNQQTGANDPNVAQALASSTFGNCFIGKDWGTPGSVNSTDATVWPMYTSISDSQNQNSGTLAVSNPPTMGGPAMVFRLGNGLAGSTYTLGYADAPAELPFEFFLGGNPGALLLDVSTANFLYDPATFLFDGSGASALPIDLPVDPNLLGKSFTTQWIAFDVANFLFVASNAVQFTVCP